MGIRDSISLSQDAKSASTRALVRKFDTALIVAAAIGVAGAVVIVRFGVTWLLTGVLQ